MILPWMADNANPQPKWGPQEGTLRKTAPRDQSQEAEVCFNPPPAFRPGETRRRREVRPGHGLFQSAPGVSAGGDGPRGPGRSSAGRFNPPPAFRPGETRSTSDRGPPLRVSIRPRRFGRGRRAVSAGRRAGRYVSIRPRRFGRGRRSWGCDSISGSRYVSIRPRRFGRGRRKFRVVSRTSSEVSIRPRRFGRGRHGWLRPTGPQ